jgi:hypothetical protein
MVAEDTFRPPWFHRNVMSEAMGLISGAYDAKADGFAPGGLSLHNLMSGHGPDVESWRKASEADLKPAKIDNTLAFMVETCWPYRPTQYALDHAQPDYDAAWAAFVAHLGRYEGIGDPDLESIRFVATELSAGEVSADLHAKLGPGDKLVVARVMEGTYCGWLSPEVWAWTEARVVGRPGMADSAATHAASGSPEG